MSPSTRVVIVAALYVVGWLGYFVARPHTSIEIQAALAVVTSLAAGWAIGRWWAVLLPVAVVPIFASRLPYTPGGEPDYGVGAFYTAGFTSITILVLGAGVLGAKLMGD